MNTLNKILILQSILKGQELEEEGLESSKQALEPSNLLKKWTLFDKSDDFKKKDVVDFIKKEKLEKMSIQGIKELIEGLIVVFKTEWIGEIKELEGNWNRITDEIKDIEENKIEDQVLYEEYVSIHGEPKMLEVPVADVEKVVEIKNEKEPIVVEVESSHKETEIEYEEPEPQPEPEKEIHKRTRSRAKADSEPEEPKKDTVDDESRDEELDEPVSKRRKHQDTKEPASVVTTPVSNTSDSVVGLETEPEPGIKSTPKSLKTIQNLLLQILSQLESHRYSSMFLNPVTESDEPEYFNLIHKPTDLKTIHRKIRSGDINSLERLDFEVRLMLANAVMYNDMESGIVHNSIREVESQWLDLRDILRESLS